MGIDDKDLEELNSDFWLEMTKEGTLHYCHEMLKLSRDFANSRPDDKPYEEHLISLDESILNYMDKVHNYTHSGKRNEITAQVSPFPADLKGFIHEHQIEGDFQPEHLMCKLAILRDEENRLNYEFLIEYDIFDTSTEIYFGVKAVSDEWKPTHAFKQLAMDHWKLVEEKGAYKRKKHRFKMTNNVSNGTFWPFWLRMTMECKEELNDAISFVEKFYKDYKDYLFLKDVVSPRFENVRNVVADFLRSDSDYEILLDKIESEFGIQAVDIFENLIDKCLSEGIINKSNVSNGCVYQCNGPTTKIVSLLRLLFLNFAFLPSNIKRKGFTPINELSKIFLDKHNRTIKRKSWEKQSGEMLTTWYEAVNKLQLWFPDLKIIEGIE